MFGFLWNRPSRARRSALAVAAPHLCDPVVPLDTLRVDDDVDGARDSLRRDWNVHSAEDVAKTLRWLLEEGHSAVCREALAGWRDLRGSDRDTLLRDVAGGNEARLLLIEQHADALATHHVRAWDLHRMIMTSRAACNARWLDERAWDTMVTAASAVRAEYTDWSTYGADLVLGARFWAGDLEVVEELAFYVDKMLRFELSPWNLTPFAQIGV